MSPNCSLGAMNRIASERLELVSMSPGFIDAVLEGQRDEAESLAGIALPEDWPDAHDRRFLAFRLRQLREQPELEPWFVYGVVLPEDGRPMIGHAGFHGPPGVNAVKADDAVEVGYSIFEPYRRRGYATEVVRALIAWASREHEIARFIASIRLPRAEIFITNAALCNPRTDAGTNRKPTTEEVAKCAVFLRRQIALIDPPVVVTLGVVALAALRALEYHPFILRETVGLVLPWHGRWLVPLYHPSPQVLASHRREAAQLQDYRAVARALQAQRRARPVRREVTTYAPSDESKCA